mmetsp:Transcript_140210/g.349476  ORF Transcript_140210/g.349476 Transcript_140210/m.349476 type:complete len:227 (-) Transcript_140210:195-875(-)
MAASSFNPTAIYCIGLNYKQHAKESNMKEPTLPVVFTKPPSSVIGPGEAIVIPAVCSDEVDYEAELAVIIGKPCKNVSEAEALDYVQGYTVANDVSARNWQLKLGGGQWCRGKSFDTFCPLGPRLVPASDIPDPNDLEISCSVNGQVLQKSNTKDMIFSVRQIIAFLSQGTTLQPGTVILTGTPEGVGAARKPPVWLKPGDKVTVSIEKIGDLTNPVTAEMPKSSL